MNRFPSPELKDVCQTLTDRCAPLGLIVTIVAADCTMAAPDWRTPEPSSTLAELLADLDPMTVPDPASGPESRGPGLWRLVLGRTVGPAGPALLVALYVDTDALDPDRLPSIIAETGSTADQLSEHAGRTRTELDRMHALLCTMVDDLVSVASTRHTVRDLSLQLSESFEQISTLYSIGRSLNNLTQPRKFIGATINHLVEALPFRWAAVHYPVSHHGLGTMRERLLVAGEMTFGPENFTRAVADSLASLTDDPHTRIEYPGASPLGDLAGGEVLLAPIRHDKTVIGGLLVGGKISDDPEASSVEMQLIDAVAGYLGVFHQNVARFEEQHTLFTGTVRALSSAIDAKDPYTQGHSERVGLLTRQITECLGWTPDDIEQAHLAGLLHDVGKIGVAEAVLCKPGKLTTEEFDEIKKHPVIGYEILKDIPPMAKMLPGVLHHHESMDGSGYPDGLTQRDIPLIARIIAVADGFDAMSSNRAYRAKMPRERVYEILRDGAGTQWDAEIVALFLELDLTTFDALIECHRDQSPIAA